MVKETAVVTGAGRNFTAGTQRPPSCSVAGCEKAGVARLKQVTAALHRAASFVGSELVHQLLAAGFAVRGTARDPSNEARVGHLKALAAALPGTLTLHAADLLIQGSFDDIVKGADLVFHVASPVLVGQIADPQKELLEPAVNGTRNLMGAVARAKEAGSPVRRVVLTSSASALKGRASPDPPKNGALYTGDDWNNTSTADKEPYPLSKVEAERAAFELAKEHGIDLVTVVPSVILGPPLSIKTSTAVIAVFQDVLAGNIAKFNMAARLMAYTDVRDVAQAHIRAALTERPTPSCRYIVTHRDLLPARATTDAIKAALPGIQVQDGVHVPGFPRATFDNSAVTEGLGIKLTPLDQTIADMVRALVALGGASPQFA